jgi:UDP-GlcNAc:undecaprenyl-phosphate GlcNAc-1-phosphate transferase
VSFIPNAAGYLPLLLLVLAVAAVLSLVLTPPIRRLAIRLDAVDRPGLRRVNTSPVPRGGGVAVAASFVLVTLLALVLVGAFRVVPVPSSVQATDLVGLLLGGVLAAAFGVIDDYFDLKARGTGNGLAIVAILCGITVDRSRTCSGATRSVSTASSRWGSPSCGSPG